MIQPIKCHLLFTNYIIVSALLLHAIATIAGSVKVLDINDKLPELLKKHPEKGWLIKFYAPWCHHCQQLEPVYNNVAESLYGKYNDLIVGRVDCTKTGGLCGKYGIDSYPTIIHIDKNFQTKYRGDRSEQSLVAFAERLQRPTVNSAHSCEELTRAVNEHGLVILSTISDETNEIRKEFESLALAYKSTYWFYQYLGPACENHSQDGSLYVLKRHLSKPIKFEDGALETFKSDNESVDLKGIIVRWLNKESFPVYGPISYRNIERAFETGKLLVIAVLDEYKPARRFSKTSQEFHGRFEELAKKYATEDDQLLFAWSSDLEFIQYITIGRVDTPNLIIVQPDLSHHLMLTDSLQTSDHDKTSSVGNLDVDRLNKLSEHQIRSLIAKAKEGKLTYTGGSNYLFAVLRFLMGNLNKFLSMYKANPLLVSLIFGFPSVIIMFVIYTTCLYNGPDGDSGEDEDELLGEDHSDYEAGDEDDSSSNGHLKQD